MKTTDKVFINSLETLLRVWKEVNVAWIEGDIDPEIGSPQYPFNDDFSEFIHRIDNWIFEVRNDLADNTPIMGSFDKDGNTI